MSSAVPTRHRPLAIFDDERWKRQLVKLKLILLAALFAPILAFATPADAAPAHDDQIERLYLTVLGRTPDAAGLVYWADRRVDGETLEDLTRTFLTYPEVELRSSGDLLVDAYRNALHREPDAAGYAYWSTIDPVVAVLMISESLEHQITTGTLPPPIRERHADSARASRQRSGSFRMG